MKTIASTSTLLLVCLGCGVLSLGFGSCSSSSSSSGGGNEIVPDAAAGDSGASGDVGPAVDTGSGIDAAPRDTGAPESGGDDAGSCGEPHTTLGTVCDGCIATNCDPTWCACVAGTADPDAGDAGSGCLQYVACVEGCVQSDSGSPTDCLTTVCAVAPFTTPQQQAGHSFLDCLVQYCGSECGQ
jgi:hypothetical protein